MKFDYDLFVIGGGSGGVRAARMAAELGLKVGLCEEYRMGGTCVIRGCVPKKLYFYASSFSETFKSATSFGWEIGKYSFDWSELVKAKDDEILRLEKIYHSNLIKSGVKIFNSTGRIDGAHQVSLSSGEIISSKFILIAVGGAPYIPNFEGSNYAISSNDVFDLKSFPKNILIVGGGYIACEFSSIFNGLGSNVTQFYRGTSILRGFDQEITDHVKDSMVNRGVSIKLQTEVQSIKKTDDGFFVTDNKNSSLTVDCVLFATGRKPQTNELGLKELGLELGELGEVLVNDYSQTQVPSIFAVGDVTNRANLTPVAIREASAFVKTVFEGESIKSNLSLFPTAIFTQPEIGTVGVTEEIAKNSEPIEVYVSKFRPMANILSGKTEQMLMKLIVSVKTKKVLGVHIVGSGASEIIQLAGVALQMGATKVDFDNTLAVHPTAAEELVTMKLPTRVS